MKNKFQALNENNTWDLVPNKANLKIIGTKGIHKIKGKWTFVRYKDHLVAQGFKKHERIDYNLIYSYVIKASTITIVLTLAVTKGFILRQIDVKSAFLHGELNELVFISQQGGYIKWKESKCST